jgi:soluble lytic murein transglycosylase-like protein
MQLMPATARGLGVNALDPAQAVDGAARLLKSNLDTFGSTELAVAAYNAGPAAVRRYGGVPPFSETQTYVRRVLAGMGGN